MKDSERAALREAFESVDGDKLLIEREAIVRMVPQVDRIPGQRIPRLPEPYMRLETPDGDLIAQFVGINSVAAWLRMRFGALGARDYDEAGDYRTAVFFELRKDG